MIQDQFDVSLEDSELLEEVELTTNLIIAANASPGHLSQDEIDSLLGLTPTYVVRSPGPDRPRVAVV